MTDNKLTQQAALAAGIELEPCTCSDPRFPFKHKELGMGHWSPLHDDGDALRLSVLLCIDVLHRFVGGQRVEALAPGGPVITEYCDHETRRAATRKAIVRAAAQLTPNA